MARVSRAKPSRQGEPGEYRENAKKARAVRESVGAQLHWSVTHQDLTGSAPLVGRRVQEWIRAEKEGDALMVRAALADIAQAAGAYMAHLDLTNPAWEAPQPKNAVGSANG